MRIFINRGSVCMGDDVEDHNKVFNIQKDYTLKEFLNYVIESNYFPRISGNDVSWTVTINNIDYYTYYTLDGKIVKHFETESEPSKLLKDKVKVFFRYNSKS